MDNNSYEPNSEIYHDLVNATIGREDYVFSLITNQIVLNTQPVNINNISIPNNSNILYNNFPITSTYNSYTNEYRQKRLYDNNLIDYISAPEKIGNDCFVIRATSTDKGREVLSCLTNGMVWDNINNCPCKRLTEEYYNDFKTLNKTHISKAESFKKLPHNFLNEKFTVDFNNFIKTAVCDICHYINADEWWEDLILKNNITKDITYHLIDEIQDINIRDNLQNKYTIYIEKCFEPHITKSYYYYTPIIPYLEKLFKGDVDIDHLNDIINYIKISILNKKFKKQIMDLIIEFKLKAVIK